MQTSDTAVKTTSASGRNVGRGAESSRSAPEKKVLKNPSQTRRRRRHPVRIFQSKSQKAMMASRIFSV